MKFLNSISIIVPCYNEIETIRQIIHRCKSINLLLKKEIVVVDDGSTDGTLEAISEINDIIVTSNGKNVGKGASVKRGLELCSGNIIVIQDADMEYKPEDIPRLINPIVDGHADAVFGSRFLGLRINMSPSHFIANRMLTLTTNLLFRSKITDVMSGSKAFLRDKIRHETLKANSFEFEIELSCSLLKNGAKFFEIPIKYEHRKKGAKIKWHHALTCFLWILKERFRS